jgi:hypothetical protein
MMATLKEIEDASRMIASLLYTDSLIPPTESQPKIFAGLFKDVGVGMLPSKEEMEMLAYGDQDDESVDDVAGRFPATVAAIDSFF